MMRLLVSAKATDANTFVMQMKEPYYPMLTELAVTRPFAFVSPKVMKNGKTKDGITSFVGSGPWILTEHVIDEYSVFERNENYWGKKPSVVSLSKSFPTIRRVSLLSRRVKPI